MKTFSPLELALIEELSDGAWHSGAALGTKFSLSRTSIWKKINQLNRLGLEIKKKPQQGYQLAQPFIPLDEKAIQLALGATEAFDFHLGLSLDSTNRYLKDLAPNDKIAVCSAEQQTQGRGRFGRSWYSPFGENIYLSVRLNLDCCLNQLSGLSLVVSLAVIEALKAQAITGIEAKWPNDLLWQGKKLAGILLEIMGESHAYTQIIIGIGLNVNSQDLKIKVPDKDCCSLRELTGHYTNRNHLIAEILSVLQRYIETFLNQGFDGFYSEWQKVDHLQGKWVHLTSPRGMIQGIAQGVNSRGELCLLDDKGERHHITSGECSIGNQLKEGSSSPPPDP